MYLLADLIKMMIYKIDLHLQVVKTAMLAICSQKVPIRKRFWTVRLTRCVKKEIDLKP